MPLLKYLNFKKVLVIFLFSTLLTLLFLIYINYLYSYTQFYYPGVHLIYALLTSYFELCIGVHLSISLVIKKPFRILLFVLSSFFIFFVYLLNFNLAALSSRISINTFAEEKTSDLILTFINSVDIVSFYFILGLIVILILSQIFIFDLYTKLLPLNSKRVRVISFVFFTLGAYLFTFNSDLKNFFIDNTLSDPLFISYSENYNQVVQNQVKKDTNYYDYVDTDENIFIIQGESINGYLINKEITPNLFSITNHNFVNNKLQSPATTTVRSLESIFCNIPPTLETPVSQNSEVSKELSCLPELLKQNGYKTIFLNNGSISVSNLDIFVKDLGFDEIYSNDLFKNTDEHLKWGYPEDIALERYFQKLDEYKDEKVFVYMELGVLNHYPFDEYQQLDRYKDLKNKKYSKDKHVNNITVSTQLQDKIIGDALIRHYLGTWSKNSNLIIFGDQSWPIAIHKNNYGNWIHSYQENHVTGTSFRPTDFALQENLYKGSISEKRYSSTELFGLIANLGGIRTTSRMYYDLKFSSNENSVVQESTSIGSEEFIGFNESNKPCIISVQPYADKKIATIIGDIKTIYPVGDLNNHVYEVFNLSEDPYEYNNLASEIPSKSQQIQALEECFNNSVYR